MRAIAPVVMVDVEVGTDLPDISPRRSDGAVYRAAQVIVRDGGVVIGQRRVPLDNSVLGKAELAGHLAGLWHGGRPRKAPRPPMKAPFISVVVPSAMQRPQELARCVERLAMLEYQEFEVILVDNRPDGTPQRKELYAQLSAHPRVRVVQESVPGSSAARNRGIAAAAGEIIAFTDDDIVVENHWLTAIANRFAADPFTDCVTGWVFPAELETTAQVWFESSGSTIGNEFAVVSWQRDDADRYTAVGRRPGAADPERVPIYRGIFGGSGNLAVRAEVLKQRGGFQRALGAGTIARGGEDIEFLSRLLYHGHRVTMDPAVAVHHHHRRDYAGLRGQMFGYGTGYTAALTALVLTDPRHLAGLLRMAGAFGRILKRREATQVPAEYPARLRWVERWGLLAGPVAYLRSRLALRRRGVAA